VQSHSIIFQSDCMRKFNIQLLMILVFMSINYLQVSGQYLVMTGSIGVRTDCQSNANGFIQTICVRGSVAKNLEIGIAVGHAFTESQSKIFDENSPNAYIRHVKQPIPEGVINNLWKESSFPGFDIQDKGNRYDDIFVSLSANYLVINSKRNNIHAGSTRVKSTG
jgi:hypothetical protein